MNFNMHQSVNKTENFLDSLITLQLIKLFDNISNQFNHQFHLRGEPYVNDCFFGNFFQKNENIY